MNRALWLASLPNCTTTLKGQRLKTSGFKSEYRDLYSGLIPLHILYHASREPIFGLGMIEELGRHGYKLSPGTIYPLLHSMEEQGLLKSMQEGPNRNGRRVYWATAGGRVALAIAKDKVQELFSELFEDVIRAARKTSLRGRKR
jgi:DNA-binding PadR family transcriptional regulator